MEGTVTPYRKAFSFLLETYGTDEVIGGTDANMMKFSHAFHKMPTEYAESL